MRAQQLKTQLLPIIIVYTLVPTEVLLEIPQSQKIVGPYQSE